jgi:hypothetical protein
MRSDTALCVDDVLVLSENEKAIELRKRNFKYSTK